MKRLAVYLPRPVWVHFAAVQRPLSSDYPPRILYLRSFPVAARRRAACPRARDGSRGQDVQRLSRLPTSVAGATAFLPGGLVEDRARRHYDPASGGGSVATVQRS
jgi:hypothetical protein